MPIFFLDKICSFLGYLLVQFPNPRRRVLLSNLSHAFPYWSKEELHSNAKESAARMIEMGLFSLIYPYMSMDVRRRTVFYDKQAQSLLENLNKKDTPVLFLLPHVCLFESLASSPFFRPANPKKMGAIYRPNRNLSLDKWIRDARLKTGIEVFSRKAGLRESMYFLRQKNWLTILFDQNGGQGGTDFLFLDRVASLTPLPDIFSKIENIRIVYACPKRIEMFRTKLFLKEINLNEDVSVCQKAHELLSHDIKSCPKGFPEWLWAHGKWKVHYYPEVRFNLSSRRSFLKLNKIPRSGSRMVIRLPNWLGDVVMSLPIIRALREARPDMYFIILGRSMFKEFIEKLNLSEMYQVVDWENRTKTFMNLIEVRCLFPECQLLLTNSLRGDLEAILIGAPFKLGLVVSPKERPLLTHSIRVSRNDFLKVHQTKTWERLVQSFGFDGEVCYEKFDILDSAKPKGVLLKRVGIAIGSSNQKEKQWPAEYWAEFINKFLLEMSDYQICLFGVARDSGLSQILMDLDPGERILNFVGKTSVLQLANEYLTCQVIIGCDSGGVHLASSLGVPTVTMFGPTNPIVTSPCYATIRKEIIQKGVSFKSMENIKPDDALSELLILLKKIHSE